MMGALLGFFFGLAFLPSVVFAILLHAYFTFPIRNDTVDQRDENNAHPIVLPGDDVEAIKRAQDTLEAKFQPRDHQASNFAGYFAVTREFTPGGVNSKPLERTTPLGSTTVSAPSPSVYQSMYRSIFDRKPSNSPLDNKGAGKPQRRGGNVFYVVLRHGHLMLFDDDEQIEVRHVVSLQHHAVSIFSGGDETPEGELFIKRNAICLSRRTELGEYAIDGKASKPFYLFSENCSDKEDFYFALLRNQERRPDMVYNPPIPLQYEIKDIITLVQRLHSSEEHMQTRWINALIGRVFLALYKTPEVENFVRAKITKKISRVKTPSFLSRISLRNIDMGEAAPVITNPRLKDLTVDGELVVEADLRYSGGFRIEVAATARIELGSRFKAREVNMLLAVVLKRIEGHIMIRIKPPPSNRLWLTFSTMPKIDMTIEPIVSSRQITYTLILRQIENRIKEVVVESLVYPNWDDSPFYHSENQTWRGGIWAHVDDNKRPQDPESTAAEDGDVDEVEQLEAEADESTTTLPNIEKNVTTSLADSSSLGTVYSRKASKSTASLPPPGTSGPAMSGDIGPTASQKPKAIRSGSFASSSSPVISTDVTNADALRYSNTPPDHGNAMAAISALSHSTSPSHIPIGSSSQQSRTRKSGSCSSTSSQESTHSERNMQNDTTHSPGGTLDLNDHFSSSPRPSSPGSMSNMSLKSETSFAKSFGSFARDQRREDSHSSLNGKQPTEPKRLSLAAVTSAAATAKKWGWNAIQRHADQKTDGSFEDSPSRPLVMGRGQPLPPPGMPLPFPDKKTKTAPIPVPKRKPIPPPNIPPRHKDSGNETDAHSAQRYPLPPPLLPQRRNRGKSQVNNNITDDGIFVVAAPAGDSEPTTPISESIPTDKPSLGIPLNETEGQVPETIIHSSEPPRLPRRRAPHRVLSSSPEEDGHILPSWVSAQEGEARAKSTFVDEDSGL